MSKIDTQTLAQDIEKALEQGEGTPVAKELASQSHYSVCHFSRVFKQQMQLQLRDYLAAKKLELSIKAILEGRPITCALFDAGFNSTGSFSNTFKAVTGLSPKSYQQQAAFFHQFINDFYQDNRTTIIPYRSFLNDSGIANTSTHTLNITINNQNKKGITFVALYKKAIPSGVPEQGYALFKQSQLSIEYMPAGDYYLMACEIKLGSNPYHYFVLDAARRAICRQHVHFPLTQPQSIILNLRERNVDDPPINVNLPKLLYDVVHKR